MSMLKQKPLFATGILLFVALHWPTICLGDKGGGETEFVTTPAPYLGREDLHEHNRESNEKDETTTDAHVGQIRKREERNEDGEEDDGYMDGTEPNDSENSKKTTEKPDEVDDGYPEDWVEVTTTKPIGSNDESQGTTTKPSESDDGYDTEVEGKGKGNDKGKGKGKDKAKGKEKKKTGLDSILPQDCGRIPKYNISGYIAGGFDARLGEYPPYVRVDVLRKGEIDRDFCGGTLISNRHIITAAHCLEHAKEVDVTPTIHSHTGKDKVYKSKKFCFPAGYSPKSGITTHDIGLVTLSETIEFNDLIQPSCLPNKPLNKKKILRAVGLGANDKTIDPLSIGPTTFPDVLQVLPVKVEECNVEDKHHTTVCFVPSDPKHKGDTCAGDSGGPIFGIVNKRLTVFGATSHGPPVCKNGTPGKSVNANIYNLLNELRLLYEKCGQADSKERNVE